MNSEQSSRQSAATPIILVKDAIKTLACVRIEKGAWVFGKSMKASKE